MNHRLTRNLALCAVAALASSCALLELFEDDPDEYMVRQITDKVVTFIEDLAYDNYAAFEAGGVGTVAVDSYTPPGEAMRSLTLTVTETGGDAIDGYWYGYDAAFDGYSGDGSSLYMELSGTVRYEDRMYYDATRVLSGELDVDDIADEDNTIDHIEFDLEFAGNWATGTVVADGVTITLDHTFIPWN